MRRVALLAGLTFTLTGCSDGLGRNTGGDLGSAMDAALASGVEVPGVVANRLYSGMDEIFAPFLSTFSPDGSLQVFPDWSSGGEVAVRDLATGAIRLLTDGAPARRGFAMGARFSPDGRQVAFAWWQRGHYVVNTVGIDGSGFRTVFDPRDRGADEVEVYDWSRNGQELLVGLVTWEKPTPGGFQGMGFELVSVSVEDGAARVLLPFNDEGRIPDGRAFFSPDGRFVAYSAVQPGSAALADVALLDRATGHRKTILGSPAEDQVLGWSQSGNHLFVLSERGGSPSVWAVPILDGSAAGAPILVRGDVYGFASGHVAGDKLIYHILSETPELFLVDIDPVKGGALSEPSPIEGTKRFWDGENAEWSPDGESLAYVRGRRAQVVVRAARRGNHVQVFDLPTGYTDVFSLRWSLDSKSIVLSARSYGTQGTSRMMTLHLDTGQFEQGPVNPAEGRPVSHDLHTVFKGDGGGIEAISLISPEHVYLYESPEPGSPTTMDGCIWGRGADVALSPSDDRLAVTTSYQSDPGGIWRGCLGVISTEGGAIDWIYRSAQGERLRVSGWTADGRSVLFRSGKPAAAGGDLPDGLHEADVEILLIPASGGQTRRLMVYPRVHYAALHPDGDRLVFNSGAQDYELWVMEGLEEAIAGR